MNRKLISLILAVVMLLTVSPALAKTVEPEDPETDKPEMKPPEMNHKLVKILPRTFKSADSRICPNTMQEISSPSPTVSMKKGIPPGIW